MYLAKPNRENILNKEEIILYEIFELAITMNPDKRLTVLIEVHITTYLDEIHHNSNIFKGNIS